MKKKLFVCAVFVALVLFLTACGSARPGEADAPAEGAQGSTDVQAASEQIIQITLSGASEPAADTGRRDGERFEDVIMLEGMEETVRYEHVRNDALGFGMDYDYESLVRRTEPDRECFISRYDDPDDPENYLEVTYSPENADIASASVCEALSNDYEIIKEPFTLERAGSCIRIDASNAKGNGGTPDLLKTVYVIPAGDGSLIATKCCSFESAEGFGRRFSEMVNTLVVLNGK